MPSIIWYHAEKRPDGLFYDIIRPSDQDITEIKNVEDESQNEELVIISDFLNDLTITNYTLTNITEDDCVGVQIDPLDFGNISLVIVDCSSIALVFCEVQPDYSSVLNNSNLPGLPCVPPSSRQKRSTDIMKGIAIIPSYFKSDNMSLFSKF